MKETYDYYIQQAESQTGDFGAFVGLVRDAIDVDPERYEAYDVLLSRIEEDGKMDMQTEYSPITACLNDTTDGYRQTNENVLLASDVEGYADIQFRIGKLLFLMSSGEDENLRQAASYFKKALVNGEMEQSTDEETMKKTKLAQSLETIGEYIGSLGTSTSAFAEGEYTYTVLWEDLNNLVNTNTIDSMGSRAYGIALYNRVVSMVVSHYADFASEGVSAEDMNGLLTQVEASLNETYASLTASETNRGFNTLIDGALQNISTARNMISALKGGAG